MMGRKDFKPKVFYHLTLEKMVPKDHLVRALGKVLDLTFVRSLCRTYYSRTGQPSVDPLVLFKMMLLGYLFGITSERRLADECSLNLAFRWYLGYDFDEDTPHHSVISKARARFGKKVFEEFFQRVLRICIEKGLVKGEKIFADATLVKANASAKSLVPRYDAPSVSLNPDEFVERIFAENPVEVETKKEESKKRKDNNSSESIVKGTSLRKRKEGNKLSHRDVPRVFRASYRKRHKSNLDYQSRTDPEASYLGRPGKGYFFSYKYHFTVEEKGRVITSVVVTPGAVTEDHVLEELLDRQPMEVKEVCADSQYGSAANYALCLKRGIKPSIPRRSSPRKKGRIAQEEFTYIAEKDVYLCPQGKELRRVTYDKRAKRWHYRPRVKDCRGCPVKLNCCPHTPIRSFVRPEEQKFVDKAMEWLQRLEAKRSIRERKSFAEWAIAEAKTLHGLHKTRYRGLEKVTIQGLMTATVQNIKRLLSLHQRSLGESILLILKKALAYSLKYALSFNYSNEPL